MPDHVWIGEVHDREPVAVPDLGAKPRRHLVGGHLGLQVVARDVARRRHEDPRLTLPLPLFAAVEEVRHVRVLLGLGGVELAHAVSREHLRERVLDDLLLRTRRDTEKSAR